MNMLDIIILGILIFGILSGVRRGFIASALNIIALIATIILCKVLTSYATSVLIKYTPLEEKISSLVSDRLVNLDPLGKSIIENLKIAGGSPEKFLTDAFMYVVSFLVLFIIITVIMSVIKQSIRKNVRKSFLGPVDKVLGGIIGFIKWVLILFVIFAFITPIVPFLSKTNDFYTLIENSYIAKNFLNYNFIIGWIKTFIQSSVNGMIKL